MKINKYFSKQHGFGLIETLIAIALLGATVAGSTYFIAQQIAPEEKTSVAADETVELQRAAVQFYLENNRWPATVQEMTLSGAYSGPANSAFGTNYQLGVTPAGLLQITQNTRDNKLATYLSSKLAGAQASNDSVTITQGIPSETLVQTYFLARRQLATCPECNTMETSINMNGNDIDGINEFDAQLADIQSAIIDTATIQRVTGIDRLEFGANTISASGSNLAVSTQQLNTTGRVSMGGDLLMNGNDVTGANLISAQRVTANEATINDLTGIELDYVQGRVRILQGDQLNYVTGTINSLSGVELNYQNGEVRQLTGNNLTYTTGTVGTISGSSLTYSNGTISSLGGSSLAYTTGTIGTLSGTGLTYNNGTISVLTGNSLGYASGTITTLGGTTLNYSNGNINSLSGSTLNYSDVTAGTLRSNTAQLGGLTVTGSSTLATVRSNSHTTNTLIADVINTATLNVSGTTATNRLESNSSSLGTASASSLSVSGAASAGSISTPSLTASSANIGTLNGSTATFQTVSANRFSGGMFYGTDFVTSMTSTNTNRSLADALLVQWNSCKSQGNCQ